MTAAAGVVSANAGDFFFAVISFCFMFTSISVYFAANLLHIYALKETATARLVASSQRLTLSVAENFGVFPTCLVHSSIDLQHTSAVQCRTCCRDALSFTFSSSFRPPPPLGAAGGIVFPCCPSVCVCVCVCVCVRASICPRCCIHDIYGMQCCFISTISMVCIDGFSPNFCH